MAQDWKKIGIVLDGASDLPEEYIKENNIIVVPFKIDLGGLAQYSGNIYEKMRQAIKNNDSSRGKTSQPSIGDFLAAFKESLVKYEEIVCITITSKLSGTFNSANQAKKFLETQAREKIYILDSLNGSGGQGLQVMRILDLVKSGFDLKSAFEKVQKQVAKYHLSLALPNVDYVEAGGRVPHWVANGIRLAQKKNIWPILGTALGWLAPLGVQKNAQNNIEALVNNFRDKVKKYQEKGIKVRAFITHGDNLADAQRLKDMIEGANLAKVEFITMLTEVLGAHAGPDSVLLAWEEPLDS
jgi:DegV family protein with EDD domain